MDGKHVISKKNRIGKNNGNYRGFESEQCTSDERNDGLNKNYSTEIKIKSKKPKRAVSKKNAYQLSEESVKSEEIPITAVKKVKRLMKEEMLEAKEPVAVSVPTSETSTIKAIESGKDNRTKLIDSPKATRNAKASRNFGPNVKKSKVKKVHVFLEKSDESDAILTFTENSNERNTASCHVDNGSSSSISPMERTYLIRPISQSDDPSIGIVNQTYIINDEVFDEPIVTTGKSNLTRDFMQMNTENIGKFCFTRNLVLNDFDAVERKEKSVRKKGLSEKKGRKVKRGITVEDVTTGKDTADIVKKKQDVALNEPVTLQDKFVTDKDEHKSSDNHLYQNQDFQNKPVTNIKKRTKKLTKNTSLQTVSNEEEVHNEEVTALVKKNKRVQKTTTGVNNRTKKMMVNEENVILISDDPNDQNVMPKKIMKSVKGIRKKGMFIFQICFIVFILCSIKFVLTRKSKYYWTMILNHTFVLAKIDVLNIELIHFFILSNLVVTGGTDGIGKAYTYELAKRGLRKFILIGRNQTKLSDVKAYLELTYKCRVKTFLFDFGTDDFEKLRQYISDIDVGFVVASSPCFIPVSISCSSCYGEVGWWSNNCSLIFSRISTYSTSCIILCLKEYNNSGANILV
uniref:PRESAN domain-containing protein n=1 Tax=Heterorhabditis bacteriophora TaxID=37862 RepID=A0A1I7X296_HETBA